MSCTRIVRRNLQKSGEAQRVYHKKQLVKTSEYGVPKMIRKTAWLDLRPRDRNGKLQGLGMNQKKESKKSSRRGA